jgi:putative hydrolase of the HAD superfamily
MRKYRWLLFDADGTLFDYKKAEYGALEKTFTEFGIKFNEENLSHYKEINHLVWSEFEKGKIQPDELKIKRFELLALRLNLTLDSQKMSEKYLSNLSEFADLIEGAFETIEKLSDKYKLAIITNGLTSVQEKRFAKATIRPFFAEIFISEKMGVAKPSVEYFDMVFEKIGNPSKAETMIIGDNLNSDILGGNNYGVDTCWFNPENLEKPDSLKINYEIDKLEKLLEIL